MRPVDWAAIMAAGLVYDAVRATLPWVDYWAAGDLYRLIGGVNTQGPWLDRDPFGNEWVISAETEARIAMVLGPHGATVIRLHAIKQVDASLKWRLLKHVTNIGQWFTQDAHS